MSVPCDTWIVVKSSCTTTSYYSHAVLQPCRSFTAFIFSFETVRMQKPQNRPFFTGNYCSKFFLNSQMHISPQTLGWCEMDQRHVPRTMMVHLEYTSTHTRWRRNSNILLVYDTNVISTANKCAHQYKSMTIVYCTYSTSIMFHITHSIMIKPDNVHVLIGTHQCVSLPHSLVLLLQCFN